MPRITVTQPRADCLVIEQGRDWLQAVPLAAAVLALALLGAWARGSELGGIGVALAGLAALPWTAVLAVRGLRRRTSTLVRSSGKLLLDGEPLELARVETRVKAWPVLKTPRAYSLSLWMLTLSGPDDLPLGEFPTLLAASSRAGLCEEFLQKAGATETHRAG